MIVVVERTKMMLFWDSENGNDPSLPSVVISAVNHLFVHLRFSSETKPLLFPVAHDGEFASLGRR